METQLELIPENSQTLTSWLEDFLAKHLAWRENVGDSMIQEEHSFLISQGFVQKKGPDIWYLKTLKVYYLMTTEKLSRQFLAFSPIWGMELNGRYLTAKITEFPRIGKEYSLSDILETEVPEKYFLSQEKSKKLLNQK